MKVKIWVFKVDCNKCHKKMDAVWPQDLDIAVIGHYLNDQDYCNVKWHFSVTLQEYVWGNICPSCGAYQGNYEMNNLLLGIRSSGAMTLDDRVIEMPDIVPSCTECGKITEDVKVLYPNMVVCPECFQNKIPAHDREGFLESEESMKRPRKRSPRTGQIK